MSKLNENSLNYNEESIYHELKKFYDTNPSVLYSYQDFEVAGIREFKVIFNKVRPLNDYEKNRLASELIKLLKEIVYNEKENMEIDGYLTLNPIINYYENFIKQLKALNVDINISKKLNLIIKNMILNGTSAEEIKLGLVSLAILDIKERENILNVFSIHNDYIFYVIKVYEYMENGNELIFELAKKSKGYGKLFSVMALQPINFEIKSWMIKYGAENNVALSELLLYSMISLDLLDYLENNKFDEIETEVVAKSFCMLLSDYGLDYVNDEIKVFKKLIEIIERKGKGIYSLYAIISIIYSIESLVLEDYKSNKESKSIVFNEEYKEIIESCEKIYERSEWSQVIYNEIYNIEIESSVLISCIEKTEYKLRKYEFELLLKRDYSNALLYKYAFALGNKSIKKCAFNLGLKKLPMNELLSGQDELKIDDLMYEDVAHICFLIIIKYAAREDFPNEYKKLNLEALKSPLIETRMQAITNIENLKDELNSCDEEIIKDAISTEMVANIRRRLNSLLIEQDTKEKRYVEIKDLQIIPNAKDIYLISTYIAGTRYVNMSEVYNTLFEEDIVYLKRENNNPYDINAIQIVTEKGYVLGYIPKENNLILKSLIDNGKYLYGIVQTISDNYEDIEIKIYLSYKDIVDEIKNTLLLLSIGEENYVQ